MPLDKLRETAESQLVSRLGGVWIETKRRSDRPPASAGVDRNSRDAEKTATLPRGRRFHLLDASSAWSSARMPSMTASRSGIVIFGSLLDVKRHPRIRHARGGDGQSTAAARR